MILLVHLLFGAAIGSVVKNIPLAIILAFLSHYFLDFFPHIEYDIENVEKKQWRKMLPNISKIVIDFCSGIILILIFSENYPIIYICAFFAIIPDGFTVLNNIIPNKILEFHRRLHIDKIHFFKDKKISNFWRITSQVIAVIISIALLTKGFC
jgi:hypothetical protein